MKTEHKTQKKENDTLILQKIETKKIKKKRVDI